MTKLPLKLNLMPLTGLVMAAWLALTLVAAQAQDAGKDAFKKCEAELMADYANKISRVQSDGRPHLVPIYERRRGEAIANLCPLQADIAAADQKIAANRAEIAAADQKIAANRAEIAANDQEIAANDQKITANRAEIAANDQKIAANNELIALFKEARRIADKITAGSNNPEDFKALNAVYLQLQARQSSPGVAEVLPLVAGVLARGKTLLAK